MNNPTDKLSQLTDVRFMTKFFRDEVLAHHDSDALHSCELNILREHTGKTIVRYALRFRTGRMKVYVGLLWPSPARAQYAFSVLKRLTSAGFDGASDLRVPTPTVCHPTLHFLLMERAEGLPLGALFAQQGPDLAGYVEAAARWLAKLHGCQCVFPKTRLVGDAIAETRTFVPALCALFPELASKIEAVGAATARSLARWLTTEIQPIHGDYHPGNILVGPYAITVVDFDESSMGDPAFDLGYFAGQAKMSCGFTHAALHATNAFVTSYLQAAPRARDIQMRMGVYEAQTYLQRAYHTYCLLELKPDSAVVAQWLAEAKACLERAGEQIA